ncbi:MAG TPA: ABC transporter substrate-binding protein [Candidatus Binatia bacterium]
MLLSGSGFLSVVLCNILFAFCLPAQAQQPTRVYRVGYLSPTLALSREVIGETLRGLGYVEGQNIQSEWRVTKGDASLFPTFAAELVRLKVDCIVTLGIPAIRAASQATRTIPIVMNLADDPVQMGVMQSLARPGSNITGFTNLGAELVGKRLELLKEAFPKLHRVAHLWTGLSGKANLRETDVPARALKLQMISVEMKGPDDLERSFQTASKQADALMLSGAGWMNGHRARIATLAIKSRLPAVYGSSPFILDGGLMSYGADSVDQFRRMAYFVDKILKGAKPADLPVEQPTKFELVINLKTAKQIGLTIPPNVLARADKVIR